MQDPISERWRACEGGGAILENYSSMAMLARELQEQLSTARATSWRKTELSESRNQMVGRFGTKLNFLSLCAWLARNRKLLFVPTKVLCGHFGMSEDSES